MNTQKLAQLFRQFDQVVKCSFTNLMVVGSSLVAVTYTSDIAPVLSKGFLDIQANRERGFNLKCVRDIRITYS